VKQQQRPLGAFFSAFDSSPSRRIGRNRISAKWGMTPRFDRDLIDS
jgi:hypothetical protein